MAYVLSLQPHSPLKRSFSDTPYLQSCSSSSLLTTTGTVSPLKRRDENKAPRPTSQSSSKQLLEVISTPRSGLSDRSSRHGVCWTPRHAPVAGLSPAGSSLRTCQPDSTDDLPPLVRVRTPEITVEHTVQGPVERHTSTDVEVAEDVDTSAPPVQEDRLERPHVIPEDVHQSQAFRRWVNTIKKKSMMHKSGANQGLEMDLDPASPRVNIATSNPLEMRERSIHRKSESYSSSTGFITAIKSATVTLATASVSHLRGHSSRTGLHQRASGHSDIRSSFDSHAPSLMPVIDEATWLRSIQRRKILEELVSTEEGYLSDMKLFVNVYLTLLASVTAISPHLRASVRQTVTQIVELHESLLEALRRLIPNEGSAPDTAPPEPRQRARHTRWHSADIATTHIDARKSTRKLRHSFEIGRMGGSTRSTLTADPTLAAEVAKIFDRFMRRFLIYESWAAQSELMHTAVIATYRSVPATVAIERGLEVLANVEGSINSKSSRSRKGLTLLDLLIKPIQRICRYPLLFEGLCKQTPACDDPVAHGEIQKVLIRLREMTDEINKATDNRQTRYLVETSWTLQDRLVLAPHICAQSSPSVVFHLLGRVIMCGALHVAYETNDGIRGQYMVCVLYRSSLLLASVNHNSTNYSVAAIVPLVNAEINEPDNGRGLQCHTARYTWKLVVASNHRLCELMLSACSKSEEDSWITQLRSRIMAENRDLSEGRTPSNGLFCCTPPDLRSIGPAFGHPESLARRISMQRAATLGPGRVVTRQVIIKNTQAQRQSGDSYQSDAFPVRSQTQASSGHVPTLAPRRAERVRLETMLSDIWTKDVIPYPGMLARRSENPIRSSASSMMRKLSMASLASNFSKRSASAATTNRSSTRTSAASRDESLSQASIRSRCTQPENFHSTWPRKVDFHTAPDAFLPQDFELQRQRQHRRWMKNERREKDFGLHHLMEPNVTSPTKTRPLTPTVQSDTSTSRTERNVGRTVAPGEEASTRPSLSIEDVALSPRKERRRLTKPMRCPDTTRPTATQPSPCEQLHDSNRHSIERQGDRQASMALRDYKDSGQATKKPSKVKSMLFRLWTA